MDGWKHGLDALDFRNYVAVNRVLIKQFGLNAAVLIGELASEARYWLSRNELDDGWFYSTVENVEEQTGLTAYLQREALKVLQDNGMVEITYKGLPRKRYVRVHADKVLEAMESQMPDASTTRDKELKQQDTTLLSENKNEKQQQKTNKEETYDSIISSFTESEEVRAAVHEYIKMRQLSKKPMTNRALKLLLSKLARLARSPDKQVRLLDNATLHNWQSVYPDKEGEDDVKQYLREYDFGCDESGWYPDEIHGSEAEAGPSQGRLSLREDWKG